VHEGRPVACRERRPAHRECAGRRACARRYGRPRRQQAPLAVVSARNLTAIR
jgi:hypothetical protein